MRIDGNDVLAVYATTKRALERARAGGGPTLIEAMTYRIGAHSTADDASRYRTEDQVEAARAFDPIVRFRAWLLAAGEADDAFVADCDAEAESFALAVREGVIATPAPPAEWQFDWVYAEPPATFEPDARGGARVTTWTMSGALNRALNDALAEDARMLVFGEDVGASGGVFRVTDGLQHEYGERACLRHADRRGRHRRGAVGLCFAGWRPVVELQFDAFSYPAFEQIIDHVAKMRMRTRGRVDMPMTIRIPAFGGIKGKEHHGESPETYYAHTAGPEGRRPLEPARRVRAAAPRDRRPRSGRRPGAEGALLAEGGGRVAGGRPGIGQRAGAPCGQRRHADRVRRDGHTHRRGRRAARGCSVEARVVDLRSLSPLDDDLLRTCAEETGRIVVVHEAPRHVGFGAEVAARVMELAFDSLAAPVQRVTGWDTPYPPASLEDGYLPSVERIVAAAEKAVRY